MSICIGTPLDEAKTWKRWTRRCCACRGDETSHFPTRVHKDAVVFRGKVEIQPDGMQSDAGSIWAAMLDEAKQNLETSVHKDAVVFRGKSFNLTHNQTWQESAHTRTSLS